MRKSALYQAVKRLTINHVKNVIRVVELY